MKIFNMSVDACEDLFNRLIREKEEGLIVNFAEKCWCAHGKIASIREDLCKDLNIPIVSAHYLAGANVIFLNDLTIMEIKKGFSRFGEKTIKLIHDYLRSKGLPVKIDGNDLMLYDTDGKNVYKVGSHGSNFVGDMIENVVHISINMDVELVKNICLKPMVKVPGELGSYGITAEELWKVVIDSLDYEIS